MLSVGSSNFSAYSAQRNNIKLNMANRQNKVQFRGSATNVDLIGGLTALGIVGFCALVWVGVSACWSSIRDKRRNGSGDEEGQTAPQQNRDTPTQAPEIIGMEPTSSTKATVRATA